MAPWWQEMAQAELHRFEQGVMEAAAAGEDQVHCRILQGDDSMIGNDSELRFSGVLGVQEIELLWSRILRNVLVRVGIMEKPIDYQ